MNAVVIEWVEKGESDYRVAVRESQAINPPEPDAVCFHAQQCVEKYVKAFLVERGVEFDYIHNMPYLHGKCVSADPEFNSYKDDFDALDDYSVDLRYPGIRQRKRTLGQP